MLDELQKLEKELNGIINGIPDIIKVYNPDYTVAFFNEAGYNFYNKVPEEVKGKRCYEILDRKERCSHCSFEEVIKTKKMISKEVYIPELNKFMDICYNVVIDENGELLFIVERLRDITDKKILDKILKDSNEKYRQIINSSPDAMAIVVDNKIVLANYELCNIVGLNYEEFVGTNVYKYIDEKYVKAVHKKLRNILLQKETKGIYELDFSSHNGKSSTLQISYSYMIYEGNQAILATIRDITEIKQELIRASEFQKSTLQTSFPAEQHIEVLSVYTPAKTVSGDFYRIHKVDDSLIVGILTDVRGKGISAALNISAFDILFLQEVAKTHNPIDIINNLNKKLVNYYEENYIAACCFSMNFNKNELKVVGAGITQFLMQKNNCQIEEIPIEGAFLGMFEHMEFIQKTISFNSHDKFFFFTDGLDFLLDEDKILQRYMSKVSIETFRKFVDDFLEDTMLEVGKLEDDCTMLTIEIK
jgi:PAS domain S-box-containing protein